MSSFIVRQFTEAIKLLSVWLQSFLSQKKGGQPNDSSRSKPGRILEDDDKPSESSHGIAGSFYQAVNLCQSLQAQICPRAFIESFWELLQEKPDLEDEVLRPVD